MSEIAAGAAVHGGLIGNVDGIVKRGRPFALPPATSTASLSADRRIVELERRIEALRVSHRDLCQRARVDVDTWWRLRRGERPPRPSTLRKLRQALADIGREHKRRAHWEAATLTSCAYAGVLAVVCAAKGKNFLAVQRELARTGENAADKRWRAASELRAAAIYLLNTAGNVPPGLIARAVGITPAAVSLLLNRIEERRERASFDALLTTIEQTIRGGGA